MIETLERTDYEDVSTVRRVYKNPFAKIAKAAKDNGGSLPENVSSKMMQEAIAELRGKAENASF